MIRILTFMTGITGKASGEKELGETWYNDVDPLFQGTLEFILLPCHFRLNVCVHFPFLETLLLQQ